MKYEREHFVLQVMSRQTMAMLLVLLGCVGALGLPMPLGNAHSEITVEICANYKAGSGFSNPTHMSLRGEGVPSLDSWKQDIAMTQKEFSDNLWCTKIMYDSSFAGKALQFKVLSSGQWQQGANEVIQNLPGVQSITTPNQSNQIAQTITVFPFFHQQQGQVRVIDQSVYSKQFKNTRPVAVYTPPSYFENVNKPIAHILLLQDGNNVFDEKCDTCCPNGCWSSEQTMDQLVYEGSAQEVIAVGVYNTADRMSEYTFTSDPDYGGGRADDYLDFLEQSIIPLVRKDYRLSTDHSVGILGSSLGGLLSCYAAWTRPTVYSKAGCMSSSFWWDNQDFAAAVLHNGTISAPQGISVYLDSGSAGPDSDDEQETIDVKGYMSKAGMRLGSNLFYYLDKGGMHSESYWGARFHEPMTALYGTAQDKIVPQRNS